MAIKRNHVIQRLTQTASVNVVPAEPFPNKQANSVGAALAAGGTDNNQAQHVIQRLALTSSVIVVPAEPFPHKCVPTIGHQDLLGDVV
ncbi:hypothetical protein ACUM5Y_14605 [Marinomonas dokdonensis]|uniref:hypothetical protein n=1 Tax=Marinomonas dokdonensis TaxID=328224 RepID=UPI00405591C5